MRDADKLLALAKSVLGKPQGTRQWFSFKKTITPELIVYLLETRNDVSSGKEAHITLTVEEANEVLKAMQHRRNYASFDVSSKVNKELSRIAKGGKNGK